MGTTTVKSRAPSLGDARRATEMLPGSVRLFGSLARGEATESSDIDLLVVLDDIDYRRHWEIARDLRVDVGKQTYLPLDIWVIDWPQWKSNITHPFTLEARALADGRWLKYEAPGLDVKWEKAVNPRRVRIKKLVDAISVLSGQLTAVTSQLVPGDAEIWAVSNHKEVPYWQALVKRLGVMLEHCHIALEQAFVVIDQLAVTTQHPSGEKHNYELFGEELKEDFHNILRTSGIDIDRVSKDTQTVAQWLEWAQHWRSKGTYQPEDISDEKARQYGLVAASAANCAFGLAQVAALTVEIGERTSLISEAVMHMVAANIRESNTEWPPEDFDLGEQESMTRHVAGRIRQNLEDGQWEWLYPGGEPPYGWQPPWPTSGPI